MAQVGGSQWPAVKITLAIFILAAGLAVGNAQPLPDTNSLTSLFHKPFQPVRPAISATLTINEESALIALLHSSTNRDQKIVVLWTLGLRGTSNCTATLLAQLTNDYAGKWFSSGDNGSDDELAFFFAVDALGFAAAHDDGAYMFLKQGVYPDFWARTTSWKSNRGESTFELLAGAAIAAIGMTGRPDVPSVLAEVKSRQESASLVIMKPRRNFAGAITQAAFFDWVIRTRGMDHLRNNFFGEDRDPLRKEWKASEDGIKWSEWYQTVKGRR
jgi:hypothetical protein